MISALFAFLAVTGVLRVQLQYTEHRRGENRET